MTANIALYDAFWAAFFGIQAAHLREPGVNVVRHVGLGDYSGIWFFVRESSVVVSAPEAWVERLTAHADRIVAEPLPSPPLLRELFGREPVRVIGPAFQGCLMPEEFHPVHHDGVRRLNASDGEGLDNLRLTCTAEEWEHSGLSSAGDSRFGLFVDGQLVAAAGTDRWTADTVNPAVLSHPRHRGCGYGAAVVSAVVEDALTQGHLALYQTLVANQTSVSIAKRLGFRHYATHLAVRL